MRRSLLKLGAAGALSAALLAVPGAGAAATAAAVGVRPGVGGPHSAFTVSVPIPAQTGTLGTLHRSDILSAAGPRRPGCVSTARMALAPAAAGSVIRVRLVPGRRPARWCAGTFRGVITETQSVTCGGGGIRLACPMLMIRPRTIGRFRFVVRG